MSKTLHYSLVAALAGFLFGFDTVVISGADQKLQSLWQTSDLLHGTVVMGMALWGTVLGAIFGGYPTDRWGRKKTLGIIGVLYSVSAIGSAFAFDPISFGVLRFLGGVGVGISTIAAPAYISEISSPQRRGTLVALYQFNLVLGILVAFVSNYLLNDINAEDWRWMMGVEAFPALLYTLLVLRIPMSPKWLLNRGRTTEARKVLLSMHSEEETEKVIYDFVMGRKEGAGKTSLLSKSYRWPLLLAFLIAFFNQTSGINAFLYYAPRIFELAGLASDAAFLSSVGVGIINLVFTMFGVYLIDKVGRRILMFIGSIGYIVSLTLVSLAFFLKWEGIMVPIFLFAFIAAHAIGQGSVIWVFLAEIFPTAVRASGQAFGCATHWVLAAIIPSMVPFLFSAIGPGTLFIAFALMMVGQLFFVRFLMPETKGASMEQAESY